MVQAQETKIIELTRPPIAELTVAGNARMYEDSVQDTPISISTFSGESLEAKGASNIAEFDKITTNVFYQNNPVSSVSASVSAAYIRGVGPRDLLRTIDNGVGFYEDVLNVASMR